MFHIDSTLQGLTTLTRIPISTCEPKELDTTHTSCRRVPQVDQNWPSWVNVLVDVGQI